MSQIPANTFHEIPSVFGSPEFFPAAPDAEIPTRHVVWDLALGATLVISASDLAEHFEISLNVSDTVKADGVMLRCADPKLLRAFAGYLLQLVEPDAMPAHELAANLREALASHEQLVERRAQSIAEQVVEPLRQILTAQIQQGEESRVAEARQFSDVEDQLRTRVKALAATLDEVRAENMRLTNSGSGALVLAEAENKRMKQHIGRAEQFHSAEVQRLRAQIKDLIAETDHLEAELDPAPDHQVDADETPAVPVQTETSLVEFLAQQRQNGDAVIGRFERQSHCPSCGSGQAGSHSGSCAFGSALPVVES